MAQDKKKETSWEDSAAWYDTIVGKTGHYYHEHLILPHVLRLLNPIKSCSVLDLGCGQGVLARALPPQTRYVGIDISPSLLKYARDRNANPAHSFYQHDLTEPLQLNIPPISHALSILALQNIENPLPLLQTAHAHLHTSGYCILVLNHPCFRIPRQSHWVTDDKKKLQSRLIDRYMTSLKIPIQTTPSQNHSSTTWSFHHPISFYTQLMRQAGFTLLEIEEWCSDKLSTGKNARMENRSKKEFPLFLTLIGKKVP